MSNTKITIIGDSKITITGDTMITITGNTKITTGNTNFTIMVILWSQLLVILGLGTIIGDTKDHNCW
jgi:hypothetical protein